MAAPDPQASCNATEFLVVEVVDERSALARQALDLIRYSIGDVQPAQDILSEIEERRRSLPAGGDHHLLVLLNPDDQPMAAAAGVYMQAVNAGFVTYLAVRSEERGRLLGRQVRGYLVEAFRADARRLSGKDLAWTVGEVRRESRWLRTLVRDGRAIPFELGYFHPWMSRRSEGRYILYRETVADTRPALPPHEVANLLYAIWRRAYRIPYPLQSDTFCYMMDQLEGRESVRADPGFAPS